MFHKVLSMRDLVF